MTTIRCSERIGGGFGATTTEGDSNDTSAEISN